MNSIKLIQRITSRLVRTFTDLSQLVAAQIKRTKQMQESKQQPQNIKKQGQEDNQAHSIQKVKNWLKSKRQESENKKKQAKIEYKKVQQTQKFKAANICKQNIKQKPKKPPSAFKIFVKQIKSKSGQLQNIGDAQILKMASKIWNQINDQKKHPYFRQQKIQKQRYEIEIQKYYEKHPQVKKLDYLQKKQKKIMKKKLKQYTQQKQAHSEQNESPKSQLDEHKTINKKLRTQVSQKNTYNYEIDKNRLEDNSMKNQQSKQKKSMKKQDENVQQQSDSLCANL